MSFEPALPTGYRLISFDRLGSTNDEARERAAGGAPEGTVVWSLEQSSGRGRRGRSWTSPPGNLYVSIVLRPKVVVAKAAELALLAAVALAETVGTFVPRDTELRIKWPNDLLIGKAKVSGILPEASIGADGLIDWLVLGIGVNIASAPKDTPYPATALALAGAHVSVGEVLERLVACLDSWLACWRGQGFAPIRAAWLARAHPMGEAIEVRLERERIAGHFAGLDPAGALLLISGSGETRAIAAGDVFFPRS